MIFVNFSSTDLARSRTFYLALGCEINPMFTGDKRIIDAHTEVQTLVALTRDSRAGVPEPI